MAEELRFFLRTALYALPVAAIYWYVSYEVAGSVLLLVLGVAALLFAVLLGATLRARPPGRGLRSLVGFDDPQGDDDPGALAVEDAPLPPASPWPLIAAIAATLVGLGLLFGAWLWIPGVMLAAAACWGWLTEIRS